jgi:hypothetical protein
MDQKRELYATEERILRYWPAHGGKLQSLVLSKAFAAKVARLRTEALHSCKDYDRYREQGWIKPVF